MNGKFISKLGPINWSVNEKQVTLIEGVGLKYEGKKYDFLIRIEPPESGLADPVKIVRINCKFANTTAFEDLLKKIAYADWNNFVDKHPSISVKMRTDTKIKINKLKLDQLKSIAKKLSAQIEAFQATLDEIEL